MMFPISDELATLLYQFFDSDMYATLLFALQVVVAVGLTLVLINVVARWRLFVKAGQPGWKAAIPFLSDWVYGGLIGRNKAVVAFGPLGISVASGAFPPAGLLAPFIHVIVSYDLVIVFGGSRAAAIANIFFPGIPLLWYAFNTQSVYLGSHARINDRFLTKSPWMEDSAPGFGYIANP